jgi:hypothetical protein
VNTNGYYVAMCGESIVGENREDTYRGVFSFGDGIHTKVGSRSYYETFEKRLASQS